MGFLVSQKAGKCLFHFSAVFLMEKLENAESCTLVRAFCMLPLETHKESVKMHKLIDRNNTNTQRGGDLFYRIHGF